MMSVSLVAFFTLRLVLLLLHFREISCDDDEETPSNNDSYKYNPKLPTASAERFDPTLAQPRVTLSQGTYLGRTYSSRSGRRYHAFVGIRYTKRVERFQQMAELPDASNATINATSYGPFCLQQEWFKSKVIGEEDCLFINVYIPEMKKMGPTAAEDEAGGGPQRDKKNHNNTSGGESTPPISTMFYIHGGAFLFGSGNVYLPDYLLDEEDVILITMNYRLGVLGFLSTQDDVISGNMGLKDQVVALQWVKKNIHSFGGDPSRVTIFGESAGGASVSYHLLSPLSKSLFIGAISHSGTALCPWAFVRNAKSVALKLGRLLNCGTNSSQELATCLKKIDARQLVTSQEQLTVWNRDPFAMFAPSMEEIGDGGGDNGGEIFLGETPFDILCRGGQNPVPWILGVCRDEGLTFHAAPILFNRKLAYELDSHWSRIAPITLLYEDTARNLAYVSNKVRKFYFGSSSPEILSSSSNYNDNTTTDHHDDGSTESNNGNTNSKVEWSPSLRKLTDLYSDRYFFHCTRNAGFLHSRKAPTFLYRFSYQGKNSIIEAFGIPKFGVAHGDDLQYIFPLSPRFPFLPRDTEQGQFSQRVVKLWVSFVKTGRPSTKFWSTSAPSKGEKWNPIQSTGCGTTSRDHLGDSENYGKCFMNTTMPWLDIDENVTVVNNLYHERLQFWDALPLHEYDAERRNNK